MDALSPRGSACNRRLTADYLRVVAKWRVINGRRPANPVTTVYNATTPLPAGNQVVVRSHLVNLTTLPRGSADPARLPA